MIKGINKGRLINGDCLDELKHCPDNSIDLILTDPPYGLFYYGLKWDKELPNLGIWKECHRVLKPGGFAFIMSSVRQDVLSRMIISLELAGFYTQFSSLYWTYSTGFPKAANIGIAIDKKLGVQSKIIETKIQERVKFKHMRDLGMKGQFCDSAQIKYAVKEPSSELGKSLNGGYAGFQPKPAVEAVLIAMKPLSEKTFVAQAMTNSKGITFLDGCRIPSFDKEGNVKQRVMSNLIVGDNALDLNEKELGVEIECVNRTGKSFRFSLDAWAKSTLPHLMVEKPRLNEKDFGLENLRDDNIVNRKPDQLSFNVPMKSRPSDRKNIHPTVKPLKLMSYLTVLGSRPGDLVLDPFCGSGTTCLAARLLGRKFVGIEIEKKYYNIAEERLSNITRVSKKEEQVADKSENTKRLDKIASITLRYQDKSVIDIKEVPELITVAFENLKAGVSIHDNVEITTIMKPEDTPPKSDSKENIPIRSTKEKDNVQDWADKGINISKGCSNNCRYCYARETSVRRHGNVSENWTNEQLNEKMIKKGWRKISKSLMFPTTHDITPGTYDACELVLKKLLKAGNSVLVVSKPRPDLIDRLCNALEPYKARMMFRFTISARNNEILSFWEPNAPSYEDRVESLIIAQSKGFKTSVSIEPMLDPADIKGLVEDLRGFTTDCMWIGPVKMIRKRTRIDSKEIELEVQKIEAGQTPEKLLAVYEIYKNDPLIKWKGHFRKLLRGIGVEVPEQNDDWRDKL